MAKDIAIYLSPSGRNSLVAMEARLSSQKHPTGLVLDGELKQMQEFLIALFTQRGSSRLRPSYGSNFFDDLVSRRAQTAQDISAAFALAVDEILPQLPETTITSARISQIIVYEDKVILHITLEFSSGAALTSEVPLDVLEST